MRFSDDTVQVGGAPQTVRDAQALLRQHEGVVPQRIMDSRAQSCKRDSKHHAQ